MNFNFSKITDKLQDLLSEYFKYFVIVIVVVVLLFGYSLILKPKWDDVNQTGVFDFNNETERLEMSKKYLENLNASLEKYQSLNKADVEKISKIIPSSEGISDLFIIFEELAQKSGLTLDSIDISKEGAKSVSSTRTPSSLSGGAATTNAQDIEEDPSSKNIHVLGISVTLSGGRDYNDLKKMLTSFENELRIMDINSLSFSGVQSDTEGSAGAIYSLNITTYYYSQGADV